MPTTKTIKRCPKCKIEKPLIGGFNKNRTSSDGWSAWCKLCLSPLSKAYYRKNKEKFKAYHRNYYAQNKKRLLAYQHRLYTNNPDFFIAKTRKYFLDKIRASEDDVAHLFEKQNKCCGICKTADPGGPWHTDHDHKTLVLRGVLCRACNLMLGNAKDDPNILRSGIKYLKKGPHSEKVS